jgi:DNA invertase Pin-like site-specific DNA recombinase
VELNLRYLNRLAVVYIRQSTEEQVRQNQGSRQYQEGQRDHARRRGWADERIVLIDADLGLSGMTADRPGYQRLRQLIEEDQVGGLFIADLSRGGRNDLVWFDLLGMLAHHDVLLFVDGQMSDLNDKGQELVKKIELVVLGRESSMRTETMYRGRLAKARAGKTVTQPPAGYVPEVVMQEGGLLVATARWIKDPDPSVQRSVEAVFAAFERERSQRRTCCALLKAGIGIPVRRVGKLTFHRPTVNDVRRFLKHPAYYGAYIFGHNHRRRLARGAQPPPPTRLIGQVVEHNALHEPYISKEQYDENQRILASNRFPSAIGHGESLLQGLLRCGRHGAMTVNYSSSGKGLRWCFHCPGEYFHGGKHCSTVPGRQLEQLVVEALLERLQSPRVEELRELWEGQQRDARRCDAGREIELRRVQGEVEKLKRRYLECDSSNRNVRSILEQELEARAAEVKVMMRVASTAREPDRFTRQRWDELRRLCGNVRSIWEATTTALQDRKQVLRTVIDAVLIEAIEPERIRAHVRWRDSTTGTRLELRRPEYFHARIMSLYRERMHASEIARALNAEGARTRLGTSWDAGTVRRIIAHRRHRGSRSHGPGDAGDGSP